MSLAVVNWNMIRNWTWTKKTEGKKKEDEKDVTELELDCMLLLGTIFDQKYIVYLITAAT